MESQDSEPLTEAQERMILARVLLKPRHGRDPAWPALAATAFFAVCAMTFAVTAILTPSRSYVPPERAAGER